MEFFFCWFFVGASLSSSVHSEIFLCGCDGCSQSWQSGNPQQYNNKNNIQIRDQVDLPPGGSRCVVYTTLGLISPWSLLELPCIEYGIGRKIKKKQPICERERG